MEGVITIDEKLERLDIVLKAYETEKGLVGIKLNDEADKYMNLTKDELKRMNAEECGEAAYLLEQRAMYWQQSINLETQHVNWCVSNLNLLLANEVGAYRTSNYTSYEERKLKAIKGNEAALKLEQIRVNCQNRIDRLSFLVNRLNAMARTLLELQQTRRRQNHG